MRAKPEKRLLAEKLRREQGLSYSEISNLTGISKSTLSSWLRDIPLTSEQEARIQERLRRNRATFAARALPINRERHRRAREQAYQAGANLVAILPDDLNVDELALAMLYLGDGSKTRGAVRMASVNPNILRYFVRALKQLYDINFQRLSCRLHLIKAAHEKEEQLIRWWMERIDLPRRNFRRATYDPRSKVDTVTDDYHGVCVVTYSDVYLQQRILGLTRTYIQLFPSRSSTD
ncbi:MAG TPA: helix-turn-helix transcriptional regulator [Anaerolineae bacterium]|nr:helix-turn-helix transcriptional regulator [Anaerolineae bacterium]